jgi:hypothetical protein
MNETLACSCPECDGERVTARGCTVAVDPYNRPPDPFGNPRPHKVIEQRYCCQDCGHEFAHVDELP